MRYLSPKADLTFKRVFGEHPDIVTSFLNAMLPLDKDEEIKDVEYLPTELVPKNPMRKNTIVDVRCKDKRGRQFLVEMQMIWSEEFKTRVLFNASKAYVRQLDKGEQYELLQPVYSLNLVNDVFEPEWKDEYYHHYRIVNVQHSDRVIDGLQLVFVELPKFTPNTYTEKKAQALWLRFLNEIDENTKEVPQGLLEVPAISKAVQIVEESAYTDAQLQGYEDFWDGVSIERTLVSSALRKGHRQGFEKGMKEGKEEGRKEGMKEGERSKALAIAQEMKRSGLANEMIIQFTKLSLEDIDQL